jgi:hypothetical protein
LLWLAATAGSACHAALSGYPFATNPETPNWYAAKALYHPIGQLYSGIVERCEAANIAAPSYESVLTCSAGWSTSRVPLTVAIDVTNVVDPVVYSYTDYEGTHTATGYPPVTRAFLAELDDRLEACIPHYADTNTWSTWTPSNLFTRLDIGHVHTNGTAYWTRAYAKPYSWWIWSAAYTGEWTRTWQGSADWNSRAPSNAYTSLAFATNYPVLVCSTAATFQLVLTGIGPDSEGLGETVDVSTVTTPLTRPWRTISSASITASSGIATGMWYAIGYTNQPALHGDLPGHLDAGYLDERFAVLDALRHSTAVATFATNVTTGSQGDSWDWDSAVAEVEEEWPDPIFGYPANPYPCRFLAGWLESSEYAIVRVMVRTARAIVHPPTNYPCSIDVQIFPVAGTDAGIGPPTYDDLGEGWAGYEWNSIFTYGPDVFTGSITSTTIGTMEFPAPVAAAPASTGVTNGSTLGWMTEPTNIRALVIFDFDY